MPEPWWRGPMIGLDLETPGVDVETSRIVTVAVATVGDGPTRLRTWLADPGVPIPEGAAAVHGITTASARADGQPIADVLAEVVAALNERHAGWPLVAFNAPFDLTVMDRELRRHTNLALGPVPHVVDPHVCDKFLDRFGSRKLDALCAHYRANLDDAHDAASDALAAARLAWCIGARGEVVRRVRNAQEARERAALKREWAECRGDLDQLHAAQVRWAAEQATGLREYFLSRGQHEDAASVRPDWPIVPAPVAEAA